MNCSSIESISLFIEKWAKLIFSFDSRYSLLYLFTGLGLYILFHPQKSLNVFRSFFKDANPFLRFNRVDVLFCIGYLLGIFTFEFLGKDPLDLFRDHLYSSRLGGNGKINQTVIILWGISVVLLIDFLGYWSHRLMHTFPLWYFHASHHSAKVINYYTVLRMHPVDTFIIRLIPLVGLAIYYYLSKYFVPELNLRLIIGITIFWETIFSLTSFLRHSSLPFYFPRWLSYIFVSPGMHLIHHDLTNPLKNKNFARTFAFWDLLFGTWEYRREDNTHIPYGISSKYGLKDNDFFHLLYHPFFLCYRYLKKRRS